MIMGNCNGTEHNLVEWSVAEPSKTYLIAYSKVLLMVTSVMEKTLLKETQVVFRLK